MECMIFKAYDKPNMVQARMDARPAHLEYLKKYVDLVLAAGPLLGEDGAPIGSMLVLNTQDVAVARSFANNDPYALAGIFASVDFKPWRWVINAPKVA